jgi:redox-sensitive bicupin YhaK (pirin superfamily)
LHVISEGDSIAIGSDDARVALIMGEPLQEEACTLGPFAMSDQLRNKMVAKRYLSGDLGVFSTQ